MWSEQLSSRWEIRHKFLKSEGKHLRTYKSDLEFCLLSSKKILQEVLSAKSVRLDRSTDTEQASSVDSKMFSRLLGDNIHLYELLLGLKKTRELSKSESLIVKQLTEESFRIEQEESLELEEEISEHRFSLERKNNALHNINKKIEELSNYLEKVKNQKSMSLPISTLNLQTHNKMENIKLKITKASKTLQNTETTVEELNQYQNQLFAECEKYRILSKKPSIRSKKASLDALFLDMTLRINRNSNSGDSDSSVEIVFPNKMELESNNKPMLPKLDFSKIPQTKIFSPLFEVNPEKDKILAAENECKKKTDLLMNVRKKAAAVELKNKELMKKLTEDNYAAFTERPADLVNEKAIKKKKRALSNAIDYVPIRQQPTGEIEMNLNESVFSIAMNDHFGDEPDSVLDVFIHEIEN